MRLERHQVEFLAQRLGKAAHREFTGVVAAHAGLGEEAEDTGSVDDMPVAGLLEVGQKGLGAMHYAPEVDTDDPLQVFQAHALTLFRSGGRRRPVEHRQAIGDVQHLGAHAQRQQGSSAGQDQGLFQAGSVLVGQCQVAALACQGDGQCTAHAGTCASNGGDLAVECLHEWLPCAGSMTAGTTTAGRCGLSPKVR